MEITAPRQFPPAARSTDPASSHQAAARARRSTKTARLWANLLLELEARPGRTSRELAEAMRVDRVEVARRLPELRAAGHVVNGDQRTCRVAGTRAITWEINPHA